MNSISRRAVRDTSHDTASLLTALLEAFPAQRGKSPGLITLVATTLYFTPITSSKPELTIGLDNILGVKKSGVTRGLKIRWAEIGPNGLQENQEERFLFVGERDDLFARLVGWNSTKWLRT